MKSSPVIDKPVIATSATAKAHGVCTLVTATQPPVVTKKFFLNPDGSLRRETSAQLTKGTTETIAFDDLSQFKKALLSLNVSQSLIYGVHDVPKANLLTEEAWLKQGKPQDSRPRTAAVMSWSAGPGILMLDYDPLKDGICFSRNELLASLRKACPGLTDAELLCWISASSCIFHGETELNGLKGQRIYILVADAQDIPRAGKAILDHLWSGGIGRFDVSQSGSLLERGLFDGSVWQTNRIDFAAGADCHDGLVQKRGEPHLIPGSVKIVDSKTAIPDLTPEQKAKAESFKAVAKASRQEEAKVLREIWIGKRTDELMKANPDLSHQLAKETALKAVESQTLTGAWVVTIADGQGEKHVTVQQILDNPSAYHRKKCLDPLEPDYDGRRLVGILYTDGGSPSLHSKAHGGSTYRLIEQPVMIELYEGNYRRSLQELMAILGKAPEIFDFGDEIVVINNSGGLLPMDAYSIGYTIAGHVQFWRWKKTPGGGDAESLVNPPTSICNQLLSLRGVRGLKKLRAVITAPTLRPDGSVLDKPGYDPATGLYIVGDSFPAIPEKPTKQQAKAALKLLWSPFQDFPFDTPLSRAVHLAALITAVIRPAIDRAPAFGYDAPIQGSGKTILAKCVAVIGSGTEPTIWPHTAGRDDEEARKRLYSALRAGDRFLIWDNILGVFDSAALASLLTSDHYRDRILGKSVAMTIPNSAMVMMTGNNLTLAGDLPRRVLISRIDPKSEKPFEREFEMDPVVYCLKHRQEIVAAVLTLLRFYISSGAKPSGKGQIGSFEAWDKWVRQTILYIDMKLDPGKFGDVLDQLLANQQTDPEQESWSDFLRAWHEIFGATPTKVADAIKHYRHNWDNKHEPDALVEAIDCLNTSPGHLTAKKFGKLLKFRVGRVAGGLCLEKGPEKDHASTWRVAPVTNGKVNETGFEGFGGFKSATLKSASSNSTALKLTPKITISKVPKTNPSLPSNPADMTPADPDDYEGQL